MDVHQRRIGVFREKPGSDIVKQGYLKKLKTNKKKYFVLRSTSSSGPARLDYYDSEKKFKSLHPPKRSIPLHTCFNINKKKDLKHKFAIALFLMEDCFSVIAETEDDRDLWLYHLLEYQNEFLCDGEQPRTHYELVWQGVVKQKPPKSCPGIVGPYRLCVSDKSVSLVKLKEFQPSYTFQVSSIRRCGHTDNSFFMEVGRSSITGAGELWMQVDETSTAESMHSAVREEMHNSRTNNPEFRRRSNTGSSNMGPIRTSILGEDAFPRKRATSESHSNTQGSPRKNRANVLHRPQSTVVYSRSNMLSPESPIPLGTSPGKSFEFHMEENRIRSDSMGSSVSRKSHHSDTLEPPYENVPPYPTTPDNSFSMSSHHSIRSQTPETSYSSTDFVEENMDADYLPMTPGQRSMTPSPTRGHAMGGDYLPMTPGFRSGTPSPTRHTERPGSAGSDAQALSSRSEGYMDMQPGSLVSSPASSHSSYMPMTPPASNSSGYMDMTTGQKTPTEPTSHGYMVMDGGWARTTAPIPIRANKEPGYMEMGPTAQTLPTVKEGGSGEAYLPMSPTQQSPVSSAGLRPAKVISYLSDDSMSGEFPKRAYSVGSRPAPKSSFRYHQPQEFLRRQPLDNSRSSSAPHLINQKTRSQHLDMYRNMNHEQVQCASPLSQSVKSDDCDSFMEMDFYRPRTASDSYGSRQRSSSFGKQFIQGHRPRSSSYGQASRGKLAKIASTGRTDSFESIRTTSQELSNRHRSQESLGKFSSSSRNSSSESLKKLSEELKHKKSIASDYMDMGFEKRKTPSPSVHGVVSPKVDATGYVDMTLGTSAPKPPSRGISPSSSSHSLGSSPASVGHGHYDKSQDTKIVKASGKAMQKQTFTSQLAQPLEGQLKLSAARIKMSDKRSPSSSGKESEDESYVPFQPITSAISHDDVMLSMSSLARESVPRTHPGLKVQHGYSKSFDSAVRDSKHKTPSKQDLHLKVKSEEKHKSKSSGDRKAEKESKSSKRSHKQDKIAKKHEAALAAANAAANAASASSPSVETDALQEKVAQGQSPTLDKKEFIPETDLFSNKIFHGPAIVSEGSLDTDSEPVTDASPSLENKSVGKNKKAESKSGDSSAYMEYCPGAVSTPDSVSKADKSNKPVTKVVTPQIEPTKALTKPVRHVERDYCEIDFPAAKSANSSVDTAKHKTDTENTADKLADAWAISGGTYEGDNFSYMDFDPDIEKKKSEEKAGMNLKLPNPVRSFVAHGPAEAKVKPPACLVETTVVSHSGTDKKTDGSDTHKGIIRRLSSSDNKENVNTNNVSKAGTSVQSKDVKSTLTDVKNKDVSGGRVVQFEHSGDVKTTKAENTEEKVKNAKFVVRRTSAQTEPEVLQDEGYVDLDFSEVKSHKRSSSSSSSNSEKSRRISIDTGASAPLIGVSGHGISSAAPADDIPCPETPISYICDDSDTLSSESTSLVKEPGSPYKHSGNAQGFMHKSASARVGPSSGQGNGSSISRQCSVPIGTPQGFSTRSSMDTQPSGRCRKASGPAGFPSKSASMGGNVGKRSCSTSTQLGLEPVPAGQELQKQKSMPCMNLEKKPVGEHFQEIGQSRHSFSDLSQYEEMSFPPEKLDTNKGKSHSQQQLSDSSQEKIVLNYAELELHGSAENVDDKSPRVTKSRHPSSIEDLTAQGDTTPVSYAEIDYLKTESMKNLGNKEVKFTL